MAGIAADAKICEPELQALRHWMDEKPQLHSCWPFDKLNSIISAVMMNGKIDHKEHQQLSNLFRDVLRYLDHETISEKDAGDTPFVGGVYTSMPDVNFDGRRFCITGERLCIVEAAQVEAERRFGFCQTLFTGRFEKTRAEVSMDFNRTADYSIGNVVKLHHCAPGVHLSCDLPVSGRRCFILPRRTRRRSERLVSTFSCMASMLKDDNDRHIP
jgi:hypothetical protein